MCNATSDFLKKPAILIDAVSLAEKQAIQAHVILTYY